MNEENRRPVLEATRQRQAAEQARDAKKRLQTAKHEFREWKKALCRIINTQSEMVLGKDGEYRFMIPAEITRIVYEVMINEHLRIKGGDRAAAANMVRQGFVEAVDKYEKIVSEAQAKVQSKIAGAMGKTLNPEAQKAVLDRRFTEPRDPSFNPLQHCPHVKRCQAVNGETCDADCDQRRWSAEQWEAMEGQP